MRAIKKLKAEDGDSEPTRPYLAREGSVMAARKTPAGGKKCDKVITDALKIELYAEAADCNGKMTKKLRLLARKLIDRGLEGDVSAIREILDRVEGRVPLNPGDENDGALIVRIVKFAELAETERPSSTPARSP